MIILEGPPFDMRDMPLVHLAGDAVDPAADAPRREGKEEAADKAGDHGSISSNQSSFGMPIARLSSPWMKRLAIDSRLPLGWSFRGCPLFRGCFARMWSRQPSSLANCLLHVEQIHSFMRLMPISLSARPPRRRAKGGGWWRSRLYPLSNGSCQHCGNGPKQCGVVVPGLAC